MGPCVSSRRCSAAATLWLLFLRSDGGNDANELAIAPLRTMVCLDMHSLEPLHAHLLLWPDQQTPSPHPPWCILREK